MSWVSIKAPADIRRLITSFLRHNDASTSFWRYNDVIITSRIRWGVVHMLKNDCSLHAYMYDHGPRIRMLNDDRRFYTGTKCVYCKPAKIFVRKDTLFLYMTICRYWNHFDRRRRLHAADTRADLRVHSCCGQGHVWAQGTLGKHTLGNVSN